MKNVTSRHPLYEMSVMVINLIMTNSNNNIQILFFPDFIYISHIIHIRATITYLIPTLCSFIN